MLPLSYKLNKLVYEEFKLYPITFFDNSGGLQCPAFFCPTKKTGGERILHRREQGEM